MTNTTSTRKTAEQRQSMVKQNGVSGVQRHGIREAEPRSWSKGRRRRGNCRGTDSGPEPGVQGTTRVFAISAY